MGPPELARAGGPTKPLVNYQPEPLSSGPAVSETPLNLDFGCWL